MAEETTAERDVVDTGSNLLVPARDNDTGAQSVLVLIAQVLEGLGRDVYSWAFAAELST